LGLLQKNAKTDADDLAGELSNARQDRHIEWF
jgi:hypothetical protein